MNRTARKSGALPHRALVYAACTAFAVIFNYLLGKDMAWDTLNYHIYAGFSAVHDRFSVDYFAAGAPSYFNPYIHVPFYLLITTGLSSLAISSILAIMHSATLWLSYELAIAICPLEDPNERLMFGLCAVAFAVINPILLQQIGSTFADITSGEFVLAGWLLLALAVRTPSTTRVVCAGLLCGIATGLKLTNAVHAISGFAVVIALPLTLRGLVRCFLAFGMSLGIGFLLFAAPWSYRLAQRFGNPFFPLMNTVFRSPEFTTEPLKHLRFIPETAAEALWRPFAMIDPVTMVHEEMRAPDLRYALLFVLTGALLCRWLWQRRRLNGQAEVSSPNAGSVRALAAIGCGLAVDWVAWLSGSGNSRYFLPMSSVAAVVAVALLYRLFAGHTKTRNYVIAGILGVQTVQLFMGTDYRWNGVPWNRHWIEVTLPAKLASDAALYLSMGGQSNSFLAPYLPPGSGLVNFSGGYTLGSDGANRMHIDALLKRFTPDVRVLIRGERVYRDDERHRPNVRQIDDALAPFNLRVDRSDCETIAVHGLPPELEFTLANSHPSVPQSRETTYLVSCRIFSDRADNSAGTSAHREIDLVLDRLEDSCPALFQPRRPYTEYSGDGGLRRYLNTDLTAWISHGRLKFHQQAVGAEISNLGPESAWIKGPIRIRCGRHDGLYVAALPESVESTQQY
jgi:hypothetical protein